MLDGHAPGWPQGKHGKHEERGVNQANASDLATAPMPHLLQPRSPTRPLRSVSTSDGGAGAKTAAAAASASTSGKTVSGARRCCYRRSLCTRSSAAGAHRCCYRRSLCTCSSAFGARTGQEPCGASWLQKDAGAVAGPDALAEFTLFVLAALSLWPLHHSFLARCGSFWAICAVQHPTLRRILDVPFSGLLLPPLAWCPCLYVLSRSTVTLL